MIDDHKPHADEIVVLEHWRLQDGDIPAAHWIDVGGRYYYLDAKSFEWPARTAVRSATDLYEGD